ncbi:hypothetical protein R1T08_17445 [Streptomyces sp. SBC-4]|nr:hypothetical protein [Streptomyces sp. SBC-4]MDV5145947.1 hypothetical protein [Streptomyces sp. SBC-4]
MATRTRRPRPCTYCPEPGADACVRTQRSEQHGGVHIYAHQKCAAARGVRPLYLFIDEPMPGVPR